jgi:glucosamine--fructose-6-phosphate aminotransferase (isomerizing)
MDATKKTLNINIRGTWGLAIIDRRNPTKMLLCRNGSPLHIGISSDAFFIASEKIAF